MSANIKNEKIDVTSILKDVETCIKTGLSNKLGTFFYEYDKYKKTHEEVLNLSIVKELLKSGSYASEDVKPKMNPEHELIVLRNQVIFLRSEVNKYKSRVEAQVQAQVPIHTEVQEQEQEQEQGSSQINLEIKEKEKEMEPLDVKSEDHVEDEDQDQDEDDDQVQEEEEEEEEEEEGDGDDDVSVASDLSEDNIQNIVLNVTEKQEVEADAAVEAEVEEVEVVEEEEEDEEEEEMPVKMPTFPTKNVVEVKPVIAEPEPEAEAEDDVETETEEDSDEEVESPREPAKEEEEKEEEEEEEEEEELYEVEINGVMYVTNDDEDGTIYSYINEEVGDKVGEFKGTFAHIYKGKNKGIYDKTMCKIDI
jgi:hypothetical protein